MSERVYSSSWKGERSGYDTHQTASSEASHGLGCNFFVVGELT